MRQIILGLIALAAMLVGCFLLVEVVSLGLEPRIEQDQDASP